MRNCEQTIYVDADACPVKDEIEDLCQKYNKKVFFVASYAHEMNRGKNSIIVKVDSQNEEVDLYIVNHCKHARHLGKKQRRAGMKTKAPNKFTNEDILTFCKQFKKILSKKEGL